MIDRLRRADWLTADRARIYGRMAAVLVLVQALNLALRIVRSAWADGRLRPLPTDFDAFWAASHLTLQGHAALAYDSHALQLAETIGAQPAPGQFLPYLNPPAFLLICAPLALLAYLPAMAAFVACGFATLVLLMRRLLPRPWPWLTVLALPVAMLNGTEGQTGCLSASCYAAATLLLEARPICAGLVLGLLSYKPHLALCVPVALAAARRWMALAACAGAAAVLALASWAALGTETWRGFVHAWPTMHELLDEADTWPRLLSPYAALRLLHAAPRVAAAGQVVVSAACLAWVARVCRGRPGAGPEVAATACAAMLCTPYLLDYDLVCLALPMAWLAATASRTGWLQWEKVTLLALYLLPLLLRQANLALGLPLGPPAMLVLALLLSARMPATVGARGAALRPVAS